MSLGLLIDVTPVCAYLYHLALYKLQLSLERVSLSRRTQDKIFDEEWNPSELLITIHTFAFLQRRNVRKMVKKIKQIVLSKPTCCPYPNTGISSALLKIEAHLLQGRRR